MQKGSSEDDVRRSETDIEKLVLARDVLQEQIDARVVARDAQILEADPFCKAPKTKLLASMLERLDFAPLITRARRRVRLEWPVALSEWRYCHGQQSTA